MSKSKHIVQEAPPKPRRRMLFNEAGEVRPGWRLLAMAAGYILLTVLARLGMGALLRALFGAWNLNARTVARAPGWAATLYAWQGSLVTLAVDGVAVAYMLIVCRVRLPKLGRDLVRAWAVGTGFALLSTGLFLLTDSLRLQWPLNRPHLSPGLLPLWALTLLTALAEELFTKGLLCDSVNRRWGWGWAAIASMLAFFLMNGGYSGTWISALNVALLGAACALLYRGHGLWASVGLRWGWSFAAVFLLGQGGGDMAVYRLYGVSEALLTGGDAGPVYGLWMTVALLIAIVLGLRARRGKKRIA